MCIVGKNYNEDYNKKGEWFMPKKNLNGIKVVNYYLKVNIKLKIF